MIGCFLTRLADDGYVQVAADDVSDFPSRYALIGHAMIPASSAALLEHEPVEISCIEPMHRRPAAESVSYICGDALLVCNADQAWHEAVIAFSVYRWRKP
jgi:hypothetical protein